MKNILVFHDNSNQWYSSLMLKGFTRFARLQGWRLVGQPRIAESREPARVRRIMKELEPIGVFANYTEGILDFVAPRLPSVWFDSGEYETLPRNVSVVTTDNEAIGDFAAREFEDLGTGLCLCIAAKDEVWSDVRSRRFAEKMRKKGFACRVVAIRLRYDDPTPALFEIRRVLQGVPLPCRVFAVCDRLADLVLLAAEQLGFHVPSAVSVVGVDNDETVCFRSPTALTSIQPDFESGGWKAGEALVALMDDPSSGGRLVHYGVAGLMRRGSTPVRRVGMNRESVERAITYIRTNACSRISVKDVIHEMNCSRRLGEVYFREGTGKTIHQMIGDVRMESLLVQLRRKYVHLGALADSCGFGSTSAMRAFFVQRMGCSMNEWRRRGQYA